MAFAFALLGLLRAGVRVRDAGCVAKSWPGFWRDLEELGARVARA
jgi:3-phosphoshikimate 1-carboxyvinyltransferase